MRYFFYFILLCQLALTSCQQASTKHEHHVTEKGGPKLEGPAMQLYDEVMKIHDDAMAKMGESAQLRNKLSGFLKSFPVNSEFPKEKSDEIRSCLSEINKGEEFMFRWMRDLDNVIQQKELEKMNQQQQLSFLQLQKMQIENINEQIIYGIQRSKDVVKKMGLENFNPGEKKQGVETGTTNSK